MTKGKHPSPFSLAVSALARNKADLAQQWIKQFSLQHYSRKHTLSILRIKPHQHLMNDIASQCDIGVCAADNEIGQNITLVN